MSLKTWKKAFYPVAAINVSKRGALMHSLQKWIGLQKKNLEKHGISLKWQELRDEEGNGFEVGGKNCALCVHYQGKRPHEFTDCVGCPLYELRKGVRCDRATERESKNGKLAPWFRFTCNDDAKPMLSLLRRAVAEKLKLKAKRKAKR